ncbi:uncharacterized protein LOC129961176 [Argiope bruennichi]|uniref:Uncharacterized protein n=1 Tax=Argiope bruennichi TaxID=94029 RepID=A0A8T0FZ80_ARGBR|nr:uncharacterized protein LOC129961176 [Argiope bruennichi]KAF8794183.1 hypothetical protein HNY73_002187 [Argiope bruennichi]
MVVGTKTVAAGVSAVGLVTLMSGLAVHYRTPRSVDNELLNVMNSESGAVAGRIVTIPAKTYIRAFKASLKLGQCPLKMEESNIKRCNEEFVGDSVFLAKGSMTVDVAKVQSSEDILLHVMGSIGTSVGVLGLVSVSPKVSVAVTTETKKENLNLLSSYEMHKGIMSLQSPKPKQGIQIPEDGALFLSEIELGGNELLLVTLEFESEKQKVEVEISVTFKILFWSITAKVKFVHNTFKSKAKVRIQFKSSFRQELDESFSELSAAIPRIEAIEKMYMQGPKELKGLSDEDERTHNFYYFSSWKQNPYGSNLNLALVNHDLDFLTEQNTEMRSVINEINHLKDQSWSADQRKRMVQLNETLTTKSSSLTKGLDNYHKLTPDGRQKLRDIYGVNKAPLYYSRQLNSIIQQ